MARPNLMEIINQYKLYEDERKRLTTEEIIEEMRDNIGLSMIEAMWWARAQAGRPPRPLLSS